MPGSYTQMDASQGTVQVNIRGLSGQGRVNTMIDGVPQTFFGTSTSMRGEQDGLAHYGVRLSGTQAFGAAIDQNLIADIEMSKGTFSGGSGGNAMMGSANFRTLGIQDLIYKDNTFGVLAKYSYGSQDIGPSFMGGVAARTLFENGGYIGAMFAYSGSNIRQKFRIGGHSIQSDQNTGTIMQDLPSFTEQQPRTTLIKLETMPSANHFIATNFRFYNNYLAGRKLDLDNYQLNYNYKPESDYIDTNLLFAYNINKEKYDENSRRFAYSVGGSSTNKAFNLDLNNAFKFTPFEESSYTFTPGVNFLYNDYEVLDNPFDMFVGLVQGTYMYTKKTLPKGKQEIYSLYFDHAFTQGIFGLNANFNLTHYKLKGQKPAQPYLNANGTQNNNNYLIDSNKKKTYLNTSLMANANLHELFMPFISYTKASRVPNPQEAFYIAGQETQALIGGQSMTTRLYYANTRLKNETADTYQIGFNAHKLGLLSEKDFFGFKALYYHTDVRNFIYTSEATLSYTTASGVASQIQVLDYQNGRAEFRGFELEANYDINFAYLRATYTNQRTEYPDIDFASSSSQHFQKNPQSFTKPPRDTATFDIGARFLEEKLTLGSLIKYTGKAEKMDVRIENSQAIVSSQEMAKIPTIVDFYTIYKPIRNLEFKLEVQNLFDEDYVDALDTYTNTIDSGINPIMLLDNQARGRTFIGSFVFRY